MNTELQRPDSLKDVVGHEEPKRILQDYLTNPPYKKAIFLTGTPGIGKTTLALCAARTFGFEPLEINASKSIRSYTDVEKLRDACSAPIQIHSFLIGNNRTTCVVLDEIDGSDPHAQRKVIDWIVDPTRKVPILCTGNDVPLTFKRNKKYITFIRCLPLHPTELKILFSTIHPTLMKECQFDVRRIHNRLQYGPSDIFPKFILPPTGLGLEETFIRHQQMLIPECHNDTQDTQNSS